MTEKNQQGFKGSMQKKKKKLTVALPIVLVLILRQRFASQFELHHYNAHNHAVLYSYLWQSGQFPFISSRTI